MFSPHKKTSKHRRFFSSIKKAPKQAVLTELFVFFLLKFPSFPASSRFKTFSPSSSFGNGAHLERKNGASTAEAFKPQRNKPRTNQDMDRADTEDEPKSPSRLLPLQKRTSGTSSLHRSSSLFPKRPLSQRYIKNQNTSNFPNPLFKITIQPSVSQISSTASTLCEEKPWPSCIHGLPNGKLVFYLFFLF